MQKIVYFLFVFVINITANEKNTYDEKFNLLDSLYKKFPSNDLLNTPSINGQNKKILSKYFDTLLVALLCRDRECLAKSDMICNLDFDIIYDSQDPDGVIVHIGSAKKGIEVILDYGNNGKKKMVFLE